MRLMHVALHNKINANAGDTMLVAATKRCFEYFLGSIEWVNHQLWHPFDVSIANQCDGVVVGGGGLILPDQDGAESVSTGWQWNCTVDDLDRLKPPLIIYAIGDNRFRGQEKMPEAFYPHFYEVSKRSDFLGFREKQTCQEFAPYVCDTHTMAYQPCPTMSLWHLYPEFRPSNEPNNVVGINVAGDRRKNRFGTTTREDYVYRALAYCAFHLEKMGQRIRLICHKSCDTLLIDYLIDQNVTHGVDYLTRADPHHILNVYANTGMTIGMRSHSQLIPFGLCRGFLTVVSHEKMARFLWDIGMADLGSDVGETYFLTKLTSAAERWGQRGDHESLRALLRIEHDKVWQTTTDNMSRIEAILR